MKKGFTLIELIAVIAIVGMLALISMPLIINQYSNKKSEISDATKEIIISAAELYASERNLKNTTITLNDLVEDEKLESPVIDASTSKEIELTKEIEIDENGFACIDDCN